MTLPTVRFIRTSSNAKTGPIPVSSTAPVSCSPSCVFNLNDDGSVKTENGQLPSCYAGFGNTAIHWRKLANADIKNNVMEYTDFIGQVSVLPKGQLWRMNEAGDLPHTGGVIDGDTLGKVVKANKGKRGFTYTHHTPAIEHNRNHIAHANGNGFTVNLSSNNVTQALEYHRAYALPVVTILPIDAPNVQEVQGVKVVACPAGKQGKAGPVTCSTCGLCADSGRDYVIGFRAHGVNKKSVEVIARG